jgi:1-acyl-sn-glycerol-3-phosphate acyltransferase
MAKLFGVRIKTIGKPLTGEGVLIVANHTSWLDIIVFSAVGHVSFVAKAEVATWPLFSTLAKLQETVFVERTRRHATGEARDLIRERLLAGDTLVLFPEGTSNDGNKGGERAVRVQPVSTAYVSLHGMPMGRENRPLYAWYGDMELVPHLWEALKTGPIDVLVEFHAPMDVDQLGGRKALAARAEAIVRRGQWRALAGLSGPTVAEVEPAKTRAENKLAQAIA